MLRLAALCAIIGWQAQGWAQSAGVTDWDRFESDVITAIKPGAEENSADSQQRTAARMRRAAMLVDMADEAHRRGLAAQGAPMWTRAAQLEVKLLAHARLAGSSEVTERLAAAVQAIKSDAEVPEEIRAEVVALGLWVEATQQSVDGEDLWRRQEAAARQLVADFPRQSQGYRTLLTTARMLPPERALEIALELAESRASAAIRDEARSFAESLRRGTPEPSPERTPSP